MLRLTQKRATFFSTCNLAWGEAFSVAPTGQQLTSTINFPAANAFTDVDVSVTSAGQLSSTFGTFFYSNRSGHNDFASEDQLDFTIGSSNITKEMH